MAIALAGEDKGLLSKVVVDDEGGGLVAKMDTVGGMLVPCVTTATLDRRGAAVGMDNCGMTGREEESSDEEEDKSIILPLSGMLRGSSSSGGCGPGVGGGESSKS
jgi:hypothetical protein